jgi:uncharacterized membrane protein YjjP (DUF1212 family)
MSNEINRINKLEGDVQEQRLRLKKLERITAAAGFGWKSMLLVALKALVLYAAVFLLLNDWQKALIAPVALISIFLLDSVFARWKKN